MWQAISNTASVLSIISALITLWSAIKIKTYYHKITTLYSVEKVTVAEQKSIEAKKIFQSIKEMYIDTRGRKNSAYSERYMQIDNTLDDIARSLPVDCCDSLAIVRQAKEALDKATDTEFITKTSEHFRELGRCLDALYENLKCQKMMLQEKNVKNIKGS